MCALRASSVPQHTGFVLRLALRVGAIPYLALLLSTASEDLNSLSFTFSPAEGGVLHLPYDID